MFIVAATSEPVPPHNICARQNHPLAQIAVRLAASVAHFAPLPPHSTHTLSESGTEVLKLHKLHKLHQVRFGSIDVRVSERASMQESECVIYVLNRASVLCCGLRDHAHIVCGSECVMLCASLPELHWMEFRIRSAYRFHQIRH